MKYNRMNPTLREIWDLSNNWRYNEVKKVSFFDKTKKNSYQIPLYIDIANCIVRWVLSFSSSVDGERGRNSIQKIIDLIIRGK